MNLYGKPKVYQSSHLVYLYPNIVLQLAINKESGKEVERWQGCTNSECLGDQTVYSGA